MHFQRQRLKPGKVLFHSACLTTRHSFGGVNQWHEVMLLRFTCMKVSLLLGGLGFLEGLCRQLLLVAGSLEVSDVDVKDAGCSGDPESVD